MFRREFLHALLALAGFGPQATVARLCESRDPWARVGVEVLLEI